MKSKNPIILSPQADFDLSLLGVDRIILRKIISNIIEELIYSRQIAA